MQIEGYITTPKKTILTVSPIIYRGDRKRYMMIYTYDDNGRSRPICKEFNNKQNAEQYIREINKLIKP